MHIVAAPPAKARRYDRIQAAHMQVVHHIRDSLAAASQAALVPTNLQRLLEAVPAAHDIPDTLSHQAAATQGASF